MHYVITHHLVVHNRVESKSLPSFVVYVQDEKAFSILPKNNHQASIIFSISNHFMNINNKKEKGAIKHPLNIQDSS